MGMCWQLGLEASSWSYLSQNAGAIWMAVGVLYPHMLVVVGSGSVRTRLSLRAGYRRADVKTTI